MVGIVKATSIHPSESRASSNLARDGIVKAVLGHARGFASVKKQEYHFQPTHPMLSKDIKIYIKLNVEDIWNSLFLYKYTLGCNLASSFFFWVFEDLIG